MQKQPFANVLQNRCSYKFSDIHKKLCVEGLILTQLKLEEFLRISNLSYICAREFIKEKDLYKCSAVIQDMK